MSEFTLQPVAVPFATGTVGTGPVDLSLATEILLNSPPGFDYPGGSGVIFERAYQWFAAAVHATNSASEGAPHAIGAARAANNLAVWLMVKSELPDRWLQAHKALEIAEGVTAYFEVPRDLRVAVLTNLASLHALAGNNGSARTYRLKLEALGTSTD